MTPINPSQAKALLAKLALIQDEDSLILETLIRTGVRSIEAVRMTAGDLDHKGGTLMVHAAKGSLDHIVHLEPMFARRLYKHLSAHGHILGHLTESIAINSRTRRLREIFDRNRSLFPPKTSLHSLRAAFAILIYTKTKDIMLTKELLGHRSLNSTDAYVRTVRAFARRGDVLRSFK